MELIIGFTMLIAGITVFIFGLQLFFHNRHEFQHNHKISGGLSNAIVGDLNNNEFCSSDEISRGFTVDVRSSELVPCSQLSREIIK